MFMNATSYIIFISQYQLNQVFNFCISSTTEAEYITAFEAAKEVVWIRKFIGELGVVSSIVDPITVIVTTMEPSRK